MKIKYWILLVGLSLITFMLLSGCSQKDNNSAGSNDSPKSSPIELKVVGFFPSHVTEWEAVDYFIEQVNRELAGKVVINKLGGPEVIPANEQPEALRMGTIDMVYAPTFQWVSIAPELEAAKLAEITPMEMRKNGAFEFFDDVMQKKANAKYLGLFTSGFENFNIFTNVKLDKADLSGFIMRSVPIYEPLLLQLGASIVSLPLTEVSNAMDRGVITAFAYSLPGAEAFGFDQVAKYVINPGFYAAEAALAINTDAWNKLPKDVQDTLMRISIEAEEYGWNFHGDLKDQAVDSLTKKGMEFIELPPGEKEKFSTIAIEAGWEKVMERTPDSYDRLKGLLTK